MITDAQLTTAATAILRARYVGTERIVQISRLRLTGGLESQAVERIHASARMRDGAVRSISFIAKQLVGAAAREVGVYRAISRSLDVQLAPAVLGVTHYRRDLVCLFLEDVRPINSWPWRDVQACAQVMDRLARLHLATREPACDVPPWDYETALADSAVRTLEQLDRLHSIAECSHFRRERRSLARFVNNLSARRASLLRFDTPGNVILHGDAHPGNVIVRPTGQKSEPLLIDWGRARRGNALEDASSWLHSLRYWEPVARRRHDTLLKRYLHSAGSEHGLTADVRAAFWVASASNALAGALRYYCVIAEHGDTIEQRAAATHTARNWLQIIVRADAVSH